MSKASLAACIIVFAYSVGYACATFGDEYIHIKVRLAPEQFAPTFANSYTRTEHVPAHKIIHHYHYKSHAKHPRHHSSPLLEDVILAELEKPAHSHSLGHSVEDIAALAEQSSESLYDNNNYDHKPSPNTYRVQYPIPMTIENSYSNSREQYVLPQEYPLSAYINDDKEYSRPQMQSDTLRAIDAHLAHHSGRDHGHGQYYHALKSTLSTSSASLYDTSDYSREHTDWTPVHDYAEPAPVEEVHKECDDADCLKSSPYQRAHRLHSYSQQSKKIH